MRRGVSRRPSSSRSAPSASRSSPAARVGVEVVRRARHSVEKVQRLSARSSRRWCRRRRASCTRSSRSRGVANEKMEAAAHHRREHADPLPARGPRRVRDSVAVPIGARPVTHLPPDPRNRASGLRPCARATRAPTPRPSGACTSCCCAPRASRSSAAPARRAASVASGSTTWPTRALTTRSSRCWPSSTTSAARAASPRGPTSSRCSRRALKMRRRAWNDREVTLEPAGWPGFADPGSSPHQDAQMAELLAAVGEAIARRPHAPSARGPRRRHTRRRAHRRPRRALADHARRPLQDAARCAPPAALAAWASRSLIPTSTIAGPRHEPPRARPAAPAPRPRPRRARADLRAVLRAARSPRRADAGRRRCRRGGSGHVRAHLEGCPRPARRTTRASSRWWPTTPATTTPRKTAPVRAANWTSTVHEEGFPCPPPP